MVYAMRWKCKTNEQQTNKRYPKDHKVSLRVIKVMDQQVSSRAAKGHRVSARTNFLCDHQELSLRTTNFMCDHQGLSLRTTMIWTPSLPETLRRASILSSVVRIRLGYYGPYQVPSLLGVIITMLWARLMRAERHFVPYDSPSEVSHL